MAVERQTPEPFDFELVEVILAVLLMPTLGPIGPCPSATELTPETSGSLRFLFTLSESRPIDRLVPIGSMSEVVLEG